MLSVGPGGLGLVWIGRVFAVLVAVGWVLAWPWAFHWPLWAHVVASVAWYPLLGLYALSALQRR